LKKKKLKPEPKTDTSKKRKATTPKQKAIDVEEETAATPSATDVEEILKVMTESLPIKLSPPGPHLTKVFKKEKEPSKTKKVKGKCALGPFLSILVIGCQHKCLNVNLCFWMNKVQIKSKGMFLSLSTLVLCTNILV
jgi:hypothetical protein